MSRYGLVVDGSRYEGEDGEPMSLVEAVQLAEGCGGATLLRFGGPDEVVVIGRGPHLDGGAGSGMQRRKHIAACRLQRRRRREVRRVGEAMAAVRAASTYPYSVWWEDPLIGEAIWYGERLGLLRRPSTTQVEWTTEGAAEFGALPENKGSRFP